MQVWWGADGGQHPAEVLAYRPKDGRHLLMYKDGEVEWLELSKEVVVWDHKPGRPGASTFTAGMLPGGGAKQAAEA